MTSASSSRSPDLTPSTVNVPSRGGSVTSTRRATAPPSTSPASTATSEKPPRAYRLRTASANAGSHGSWTRIPGRSPLTWRASDSLFSSAAPAMTTSETS